MNREDFEHTGWKMTYEEHELCNCNKCDRECIHRGAYRRVPKIDNGLALCPRLKEGSR